MKKVLYIFLLFSTTKYFCQTITPNVINSTGGNWLMSNGMTVTDNVGEPFTSTINNTNNIITQGFLQNFSINRIFSFDVMSSDVTCKDKNDGIISSAITSNVPYTVQYSWSPQTICPLNNCSAVDSLKAGVYTVTVQISYTVGTTQHDTIFIKQATISDQNGPCKINIYTGITANGDGSNDVFTIENITEYPNNHVLIYNRWGQLLFDEHGYNNISKAWPRKDEPTKLYTTTYFYIVYLEDGSDPIKGWVELIKD